jgi:hypothetical protein
MGQQPPISFDRLAKMLGKSKSTTYQWFELSPDPHVLGFLTLLERLTPSQRQFFIEAHCRVNPSLEDRSVTIEFGTTGNLQELLHQKAGLTIVKGGEQTSRTFVLTALGHAATRNDGKKYRSSGIDLHRPTRFVPVESWIYIAEDISPDLARERVRNILPRILTSASPRLFFNDVWSVVPGVRDDLIRSAQSKHVFIADKAAPDMAYLKRVVSTPIRVLTLSAPISKPERILITCQLV